eukprot:SAG25_NODE_232_length_11380_cov_15.425583_6_plen_110_part_00
MPPPPSQFVVLAGTCLCDTSALVTGLRSATDRARLHHDSRDNPLAPTEGWAATCGLDASLCDYMPSRFFIKPTASLQLNQTLFGAPSAACTPCALVWWRADSMARWVFI